MSGCKTKRCEGNGDPTGCTAHYCCSSQRRDTDGDIYQEHESRVQCKACPWKKSTVPEKDIPGGYSLELHRSLQATIADPGSCSLKMRMMACHEFPVGSEKACVGWVLHQLGPGNNIGLRLKAMDGRYSQFQTVGPQHARFEDTLPKQRRAR